MAISLSDILSTLQNGAMALNGLSKQVAINLSAKWEIFGGAQRFTRKGYSRRLAGYWVHACNDEFRIYRVCCALSFELRSVARFALDSRRADGGGGLALCGSPLF